LFPALSNLYRGRVDLYIASFWFFPKTLLFLERLIQEFRPDVVNLHFPDSQIPFVIWLYRWFDFRLVVSLHGDEIERHFQADSPIITSHLKTHRKQLATILRRADAVTACSQDLLDKATHLEPSVANKGVVIYNGIDPERFSDTSPYAYPHPYIFAFGRLTQEKGFDLLLESFARVANAHPGLHLILAGAGEKADALQTQATALGMQDRIVFFGRATPEQIVQLLNGAQLVVVPSRRETFGIGALEALAAGKPLLATRVGGMGEFLSQVIANTGVDGLHPDDSMEGIGPITLVEPTVEAIELGLRRMLAQDESGQRDALQRIRSYVHQAYSWQRTVEQYEAVLTGTHSHA